MGELRVRFEEPVVDGWRKGVVQYVSERSAHHVGAFALGEMHRVQGAKVEAETVELEGERRGRGSGRDNLLDV